MKNDPAFVRRVLTLLAGRHLRACVFGGWAEHLHGLTPPRDHRDLDVLLVAASFDDLEALMHDQELEEVAGKRFPHKRAFVLDGVMVECFLVERDERGYHTTFWGSRHDWPAELETSLDGIPVATAVALESYRAAHDALHAASA